MGLRDRYQQPASATEGQRYQPPASASEQGVARPSAAASAGSAAPSTPPSAAPSPAAPSEASGSSSPVAASAATTTPTPASLEAGTSIPGAGAGARRDLAALRAQLAGSNGGVNPPEAAAAVTDGLLEPCTRETPDGGAEPLPNHPDAAKAGAAAASVQQAPAADSPPKRRRRTKAEMEAARAAEAAARAPSAPPSASAGSAPPLASESEFQSELAAAAAEAEGYVILTNTLRDQLANDTIRLYLRDLSLEGAINLVRARMFPGMKALQVEK